MKEQPKAVFRVSITEDIWAGDSDGGEPSETGRRATSPGRLSAQAAACLMAERDRWFLWVPVLLGLGASLYFALPFEPDHRIAWLVASLLAAAMAIGRKTDLVFLKLFVFALFLAATGFVLAQERTLAVSAPVLAQPFGPAMIAGRVLDVEMAEAGPRVTMDRVMAEGLPPDAAPVKIRIRLTRYSPVPLSGSVIRVRGVLMPPAGPAEPGAHNFRRDLFFERIGAVGYAMGKPVVLQLESQRGGEAQAERLRQIITGHVVSALGSTPDAAIVIAYMTGERGLIDDGTADDMRGSGLAHLLALSGMKVGLAAILAFGACRLLLALLPVAAVHVHGRKIAAVTGILTATAYVAIAAAPVPALRSVLMTGMAMTAIVLNRQAISLRLAAIAACIVLFWQPESVAGVSFQMSFGAVIALISFYEAMQGRISRAYRQAGRGRRTMLGFGKLLVTTLVATLVTSPLALFHFQQEANYSIVANAIAIPLNDIWIMPLGLVSMLLMPLGMDRLPLRLMGMGVHWMLVLAHEISRWPGAITRVPSLPDFALIVLELGGLWIILWKGRWRRLGWMAVAAGCIAACFVQRPDILVSEDGKRVAFRMSDGMLAVSKIGNRRDFTVDSWNRMNAGQGLVILPRTGSMDNGRIECQAESCLYRKTPDSQPVVLLRDPAAANQFCASGAILISPLRLQVGCEGTQVIDAASLPGTGALALTANGSRYGLVSVADLTGRRPWSQSVSSDVAIPPADPESERDPR